jgi:hypothetical protein
MVGVSVLFFAQVRALEEGGDVQKFENVFDYCKGLTQNGEQG